MKNKRTLLAIILPSVIFVVLLIADLLSKHFIFDLLPNTGDNTSFLPGFINLIHVENKGAAWGILAGRPVFLIVVSMIVLALYIAYYCLRVKKMKNNISMTLAVSVGLITAGSVGNLVDRIAFGYVRDFFNFQFMNFPVFNVADICLTIGMILLVIYFIFLYSKEEAKTRRQTSAPTINIDIETWKKEVEQQTQELQQSKQEQPKEQIIIESKPEEKKSDIDKPSSGDENGN